MPNSGVLNFIRSLLLELTTPVSTNPIITGDFQTSLSPSDRTSGQNINRETSELNDIIHYDLRAFYRIFYPNTE